MRRSDVKMSTKLTVFFLCVGLAPLLLSAVISYRQAGDALGDAVSRSGSALNDQPFAPLIALRDVKKNQIEQYFSEREGDMGVLVETVISLRAEAFKKLEAIRDERKSQLEQYFETLLLDMEVFARSQDVAQLFGKLAEYHQAVDTQSDGPFDVSTDTYQQIWSEHGKNVLRYYEDSGLYGKSAEVFNGMPMRLA